MAYEEDKKQKNFEKSLKIFKAEINKLKQQIENNEKELQKLNLKLLEAEIANKRKLEFISYLSHEFKTPLNAINGFTSLMLETELPRETRLRFCRNIIKASEHLCQILENTIETARAESDKITLYFEEFNTAAIIKEVLAVLEEKIKEKNIKVIKKLTNAKIRADKRRFRQLVYNLVGNACKFNCRNGKIKIKTSCEGKKFYFEIEDTGCGIESQKQTEIFEFFSHIENQNIDNTEGSGIGLSFCKKIINLHGGEIDFESCPQKGSKFWFFIPQQAAIPVQSGLSVLNNTK